MSTFNCQAGDEMKIQHITYDETHRRRSMSRRASDASMKIKNFLSRRLSRHSDAEISFQNPTPRTERPVTRWPQPGTQFSLPDKPFEMTAYLAQQHRMEKAARKEEKLMVSANNSGSYLHLRNTGDETEESAEFLPRLRRMPKFVKEKLSIKSMDSQQQNAEGKNTMENLHELRQDTKEGRLEQVVPPRQPSRTESRLGPPQNRFVDPSHKLFHEAFQARSSSQSRSSSNQRNSSRGRKTRSTSGKFVDYIRTSADILDEKRRDVQSKFQAPFEHLNYRLSFSRRASANSSKSAESFWCIGEDLDGQKAHTQAIRETKARQQEPTGRECRLSGVGRNPWENRVADDCIVCGEFAMIGLQGLCEKCEYRRHRTPGLEHKNQYPGSRSEDDIRPTPPLKDRKTLSMRRERDPQHVFQADTRKLDDKRPPPIPVKDIGSRQFSQNTRFQDDDDEWYLNWKTSSQRDEFEKAHSMAERWSLGLENDGLGTGKGDDKAPLIERNGRGKGKEKKKDLSRDTDFYLFYDDVLREAYK